MFVPSGARMLLFVVLLLIEVVCAIPAFEGLIRDYNSDSLVPGASLIQVMNSRPRFSDQTKYIATTGPRGSVANLTIHVNGGRTFTSPPVFYINSRQLYQLNNESSVFHVNVINATTTGNDMFRVELGEKKIGVRGSWRWEGTKLHFSYGDLTNNGVYYACKDDPASDIASGLFIFLRSRQTPSNCELVTLHSFMDRTDFIP